MLRGVRGINEKKKWIVRPWIERFSLPFWREKGRRFEEGGEWGTLWEVDLKQQPRREKKKKDENQGHQESINEKKRKGSS